MNKLRDARMNSGNNLAVDTDTTGPIGSRPKAKSMNGINSGSRKKESLTLGNHLFN
jgi:hypothetical protein